MKMTQSLLLGSAACLAVAGGAQAADLPVKAKAIEYVKVCSLYGAGFYYIPGTDTCLKVGGFVVTEVYADAGNGGFAWGPGGLPPMFVHNPDRERNRLFILSKAAATFDARTQTEYGTLRSYLNVGGQTLNPSSNDVNTPVPGTSVFFSRAFIQLAGFTIGKTVSYFDIWGWAPFMANHAPFTYGDTGATGIWVAAYTAQLGNGVSATISLEDTTRRQLINSVWNGGTGLTGTGFSAATTNPIIGSSAEGTRYPDLIAALRIDQAWGWAAITGALHNVSGQYYTAAVGGGAHPADAIGFAIAAGAYFKVPGMGNDTIGFQINYGSGATGYITNLHGAFSENDNGARTIGFTTDGVYADNTSIQRTGAWGANAGYEHWWTPGRLRSSIFGGYTAINYNDTANSILCGGAVAVAAGCNNDFSFYQVGTRTQWTPVANLDIGIDLVWTHINSANLTGQASAAGVTFSDVDTLTALFHVQRDFWP